MSGRHAAVWPGDTRNNLAAIGADLRRRAAVHLLHQITDGEHRQPERFVGHDRDRVDGADLITDSVINWERLGVVTPHLGGDRLKVLAHCCEGVVDCRGLVLEVHVPNVAALTSVRASSTATGRADETPLAQMRERLPD